VATDDKFKLIAPREDIVFNPDIPKEEYDWRVIRTMMEPSYSLKEVIKKPKFTTYYKKISKIISVPDTLCIGWQMDGDVKYLLNNCHRYNLPAINLRYIDVRDILQILTKEQVGSLSHEYTKWCHKLPELSHTSDIDADMTKDVLNAVFKKYKINLKDFLAEHSEIMGEAKDFVYGYTKKEDVRIENAKTDIMINGRRFKRSVGEKGDDMSSKSLNKLLFTRYLDYVTINKDAEHYLAGKSVSISLNYERYHFQNMVKLVKVLSEVGAEYRLKATESDILVTYDDILDAEGGIRSCSKLKHVKELGEDCNMEIMSFDDFLALLNLDRESLDDLPKIDVEFLSDEKYAR